MEVKFWPDLFTFFFKYWFLKEIELRMRNGTTLFVRSWRFFSRCADVDGVKNLIEEIGVVANEAGGLIYSCVLADSGDRAEEFQARANLLLGKIEILNTKIEAFCCGKLPVLPSGHVTPNSSTVPADTFFTIDTLLEELKDLEERHQLELGHNLKDLTNKLHELLTSVRTSLVHVKADQDTNNEQLNSYLILIRNMAYQAQYLINSFVVGNVPVWFLTLRLQHIIHNFEIIGKIEFEEIKKEIIHDSNRVLEAEASLMPSSTFAVGDVVVGMKKEIEEIWHELTNGQQNLEVITICGMPGIGKTTLAKTLYAQIKVGGQFDIIAWTTISQTYNRKKVLIEILMSLRRDLDKGTLLRINEQSLGTEIHKCLKGRRYLIVIDDIWTSAAWNDLRRNFPDDGNRSRIILTTRNRHVSPTGKVHILSSMMEGQCWELLEKKIFHGKPCPPQLIDIGRKIAAGCKGLPLAIVVIAGILANMEKKRSIWKQVEESLDSYVSDDPSNFMKVLKLSYEYLPCHLKLCFLYLGAFPEDTRIPVKKLKLFWIAEGFVKQQKDKTKDEVADRYLQDLTDRSLLLIGERNSIGGIKTCNIHDLMLDMCLKQAHDEYFMMPIKDHSPMYPKHRCFCVNSETLAYSRPFALHCRSFIGHLSDPTLCFSQTKLVQILDLASATELKRIHQMAHLRYLVVNRMPTEVALAKLVNLEVLRVYGRTTRAYISATILKMAKLMHLHLEEDAMFQNARGMTSCSNNLHSLSFICIWNHSDEKILRCLPYLRKLKCLCAPSFFPDLSSFRELQSLNMKFSTSAFNKLDLGKVSFPSTIKKLTLSGLHLPWDTMSIIGRLPNLLVLKLLDKAFQGEEWETNDGEFQELKCLKLDGIKLQQWISESEHSSRFRLNGNTADDCGARLC